MRLIDSETVAIRQETDLLLVRQLVRQRAAELGFRKLGQTKAVTAASEIGRNTLIHGGGGKMLLQTYVELARRGLRLTFEDHGPGIADVERAMTDGYTTAGAWKGWASALAVPSDWWTNSTSHPVWAWARA